MSVAESLAVEHVCLTGLWSALVTPSSRFLSRRRMLDAQISFHAAVLRVYSHDIAFFDIGRRRHRPVPVCRTRRKTTVKLGKSMHGSLRNRLCGLESINCGVRRRTPRTGFNSALKIYICIMLLLRFVNTEIPNAVRCGARQKNDAACRTMPQLNAPYPVWTNLLSLYF